MPQSQFSLLATKRFLPLFVTQFLSAFNDNLFKNALVILMTYQAGAKLGMDPRILVTAAAGIFILPFFLFSATAGQLADKYNKTTLINTIRLVDVFVLAVACIGFYFEHYMLLLAVLFFAGMNSAFFGPLKYSILPDLLEERELIGGNGLVEAGTFLAILLGTILGGLLVLRENGILHVSSLMLLIAFCAWAVSLRIPSVPAASKDVKVGFNIVADTWHVVAEATRKKDVFLSIIGISWFWLVGFTFLAQFPVYAKETIGADETVVTFFLATFSIGISIGSLVCNRLLKGVVSGAYVPLGAAGMTASIFALWWASPAVAVTPMIDFSTFIGDVRGIAISACLLATSIFGGIFIVPLYALVQVRSEKGARSRMIAANNIMNAFFMVGGALVTMGLLALHLRIPDIFALIGAVNMLVVGLIWRVVKRAKAAA